MNERIRELALQADLMRYPSDGINIKIEKFAELIVKECVNVALEQKKWVEDQKVFNPLDESWNRARIQQSQRIVDKITQHFGVEE